MEKPHKKLDVWKLSMDMVTVVYRITAKASKKAFNHYPVFVLGYDDTTWVCLIYSHFID